MLVEDVRIQILQILVSQGLAVQSLYLVAHNVAVLLDVVLLVELVAKGDDVLAGHIGVRVELASRSGVRSGDVVLDEIPLLPQVEVGIELLDIGKRHFLVDGHQRLLHLAADFGAGDALVYIKVVDDGDHYGIVAVLLGGFVSLVYASGKLGFIELFYRAVGFTYIHISCLFLISYYLFEL